MVSVYSFVDIVVKLSVHDNENVNHLVFALTRPFSILLFTTDSALCEFGYVTIGKIYILNNIYLRFHE